MFSNVPSMNVAIFGAAGALGSTVAGELERRGHRVRLVGRRAGALARIAGEPFAADLLNLEQARAAAAGMDAILFAAGTPYDRFDLHVPMMRNTLDGAWAAGVRSLIHISNVYPYGRPRSALVAETHPLEPCSRKGRFRKEQEDLVFEANDPSGLRTLVLRPADYYGPGAPNSAPAFALKAALAGKSADILGPDTTPHEYLFVPDLAPIVADLFERPAAFGTAYNVAGSGVTTTRAFTQQLLRAARLEPRFRVAGPALLRALGLFDPVMRELVEMNYLQSTPVLLDDAKLRAVLPDMRKTAYADGIAQTVSASRLAAAGEA
jgi:nucleoside-diphosphate-sugar epimerase